MPAINRRILDTLMIGLPGATEGIVQLELLNAMDEFCRVTDAWREEITITLQEGVRSYALVRNGAEIVRVISASHGGLPVASGGGSGALVSLRGQITPDVLVDDLATYYADEVRADNIGSYAIFNPQYITITESPTEVAVTRPFKVLVSLSVPLDTPDITSDADVPEWFWARHHQVLIDGAKGRMMSMLAKPWSNTTLATYHMKRFRGQMANARVEAKNGAVHGAQNWRFPRFL